MVRAKPIAMKFGMEMSILIVEEEDISYYLRWKNSFIINACIYIYGLFGTFDFSIFACKRVINIVYFTDSGWMGISSTVTAACVGRHLLVM